MLVDNTIPDDEEGTIFFRPKPLDGYRDAHVNDQVWRYKWTGPNVDIYDPQNEHHAVATWDILEISQDEFHEWAAEDDGGLVVTAKDVVDYIKERILRRQMARRSAGLYS